LYEVLDDPKCSKIYIVMEYVNKGTLANILQGAAALEMKKIWTYFRDMILATHYCKIILKSI
jgi:hypothetical protein